MKNLDVWEHTAAKAATDGTPLMPRDLMMMNMFGRTYFLTRKDGKTIYTMAMRSDVSDSLDVLGDTPGYTLVRGVEFWEAVAQPGLGGMTLIASSAFTDVTSVQQAIATSVMGSALRIDLAIAFENADEPPQIRLELDGAYRSDAFYRYGMEMFDDDGNYNENKDQNWTSWQLASATSEWGPGNSEGASYTGSWTILAPFATGIRKQIFGQAQYQSSFDWSVNVRGGGAYFGSASLNPIEGVELLAGGAGTISGVMQLYALG